MDSLILPIELPLTWCRKRLSSAEKRVMEQIGTWLPTKVAAKHLGKSPLTNPDQLNHAMRKLGVSSRYKLIVQLHVSNGGIPRRQATLRPLPVAVEAAVRWLEYAI